MRVRTSNGPHLKPLDFCSSGYGLVDSDEVWAAASLKDDCCGPKLPQRAQRIEADDMQSKQEAASSDYDFGHGTSLLSEVMVILLGIILEVSV